MALCLDAHVDHNVKDLLSLLYIILSKNGHSENYILFKATKVTQNHPGNH